MKQCPTVEACRCPLQWEHASASADHRTTFLGAPAFMPKRKERLRASATLVACGMDCYTAFQPMLQLH